MQACKLNLFPGNKLSEFAIYSINHTNVLIKVTKCNALKGTKKVLKLKNNDNLLLKQSCNLKQL